MASTSGKLEQCEVCGAKQAVYTCPKCEVRTCGLICINIHKKELNCDGIRDKTKFVPLKSFTDLDLLNDYRFLEQIGKTIDSHKRNPEKKYTRSFNLPLYLQKLKRVTTRKKVCLLLMPQNFSRRKENTTYLKWKTNELFWRIEWIFPQAENTKWITERVLDSTRLSTLVEEVLNPVSLLKDKTDIQELNIKLNLVDKLQFYRAAGLSDIKVLLKAEKVKRSNFKFYELDFTLTLKENLENKTIIEFPTLYVILKNHIDMYEIIDTDEEKSDTECTNYTKKRRINNESNVKKKKNEPINYFFNDFSDSDDDGHDNVKKQKRNRLSDLNIPAYDELVKMK